MRSEGYDVHTGPIEAAERIYTLLKTNFTEPEFDMLGFTERSNAHFYKDGQTEPTLAGLSQLCGSNHSGVIYLCKTYTDRDALIKLAPNATGREATGQQHQL